MLPWLVRVAWLFVPFTVGTSVADALAGRSTPVQVTAAALLWGAWATVIVGILVPRPAGLVGLRVGAIGAVAATLWSADSTGDWLVAGVASLVVLVLAMMSETGQWLVNGTAYGYEQRYLLRPPAAVVAGPMLVAAVLLPAAALTGPLLLAAEQWLAGVAAMAAGAGLGMILFRALHAMTLRWGVLVPAGLVLKDHLALLDPVLFRRADIELLRRAPADTDGLDLTAGALGLALELKLREEQHIDRMRPVRRGSEPFDTWKVLFTPTRPAALLSDASSRRIRVVEPTT